MSGLQVIGLGKKQIEEMIEELTSSAIDQLNAVEYKDVKDCSANPKYPTADAGNIYLVSVAGKIGGASGTSVEVGDLLICKTDGSAEGTQAEVGSKWNVVQGNMIIKAAGESGGVLASDDAAVALLEGGKLKASELPVSVVSDSVKTVASSGAAQTIDRAEGTMWDITLDADCTVTLPTPEASRTLSVRITQDGTGNRALTWAGEVAWAQEGGYDQSVGAGETDDYLFICLNGETWLGYQTDKDFGGPEAIADAVKTELEARRKLSEAIPETKTYNVMDTVAVASGATNYLPPFWIRVPAGKKVKLNGVAYSIRGGTKATIKVRHAAIGGSLADVTGLTALAATPTAAEKAIEEPPTYEEGWHLFAVVVESVEGTPDNLSIGFDFSKLAI